MHHDPSSLRSIRDLLKEKHPEEFSSKACLLPYMFDFCRYAFKLTYKEAVLGEVASDDELAEYGTRYSERVILQFMCFGSWITLHIFATQCWRAQRRAKQLSSVAILLYRFLSCWYLKTFSRSLSLVVYCLYTFFLADQISCRSLQLVHHSHMTEYNRDWYLGTETDHHRQLSIMNVRPFLFSLGVDKGKILLLVFKWVTIS